ncbi:MAG: YicC/YloC family endoribonuclease [bacterium]
MLVSMTGYGRGQFTQNNETIFVEIKSVNNRYFEFQYWSHRPYQIYENKIKDIIQKSINRGTVNVSVTGTQDTLPPVSSADFQKISGFVRKLNQIRREFKLSEPLTLNHILSMPDIFKSEIQQNQENKNWHKIQKALIIALDGINKMRIKEGLALSADISKRLAQIRNFLAAIHKMEPKRTIAYKTRLSKKIHDLIGDHKLENDRVLTELLLWSERIDISEEITRLKSHIQLFNQSLNLKSGPKGKKLNFLLQEMNREANTIGSKANDTFISHKSVLIKEEIEKIREQIQNIE